jgi:hypothetical protein
VLGAKIHGAKLPATSAPRRQGHGASDPDVIPLYLGADDYDAKIKVHFLKSFRKGHIQENLSKKRLKKIAATSPARGGLVGFARKEPVQYLYRNCPRSPRGNCVPPLVRAGEPVRVAHGAAPAPCVPSRFFVSGHFGKLVGTKTTLVNFRDSTYARQSSVWSHASATAASRGNPAGDEGNRLTL